MDESGGAPAELWRDLLCRSLLLVAEERELEVAVVVDLEGLAFGVYDFRGSRDSLDLALVDGGAVVRHDDATVSVLDSQWPLLGASLSESARDVER